MAIKNTLLGGSDFNIPSARIRPSDLNDTFDASAGFLEWCASNFNDYMQLIFNADYIGFDSRLTNSGTPNLKNVFYSTFTSDDAELSENLDYDSTNDLYKTIDWQNIQGSANYYAIDVYASTMTISAISNVVIVKLRENVWRFYSTQTSLEVARALVIENLYKPVTVSDASSSPIITHVTGLTALKTSESDDEGMRGHYVYATWSAPDDPYSTSTYYGTFTDTTTNNRIDGWGVTVGPAGAIGGRSKGLTSDDGTTYYVQSGGTGGNVDSWGTDKSSARNSNENSGGIRNSLSNTDPVSGMGAGGLLFYKAGSISGFNVVNGTNQTNQTAYNYDYVVTGGVPALTLQSESLEEESTLIFKDTVSSADNAIIMINSTIDASSSEQISVSTDGGSNWVDVNNSEIVRLTAGTDLWRRIVITRTDLSKLDKVTEQAVKYNII